MIVPVVLQNKEFRFALAKGKKPVEKLWTTTGNYRFDEKNLTFWDDNALFVTGIDDFVVLDIDNEKGFAIMQDLPKTFTVRTGSGKFHLYFQTSDNKTLRFKDAEGNGVFDLQGRGAGVLVPGSIHPDTKKRYQIYNDVPIAYIGYNYIVECCKKYATQTGTKKINNTTNNPVRVYNTLQKQYPFTISKILEECGIDITINPTDTPLGISAKKKCFCFDDDKAIFKDFHTGEGGTIRRLLYLLKRDKKLPVKFKRFV